MVYYLYVHTVPNGKIYIGLCKDIFKRWKNGKGYKDNKSFYKDIKRYGWNNIKHEIIDTYYSEEEATFHERLYIIMSNSENPDVGYNRTHYKEMYGEIYSLKTEYSVYKFKPIEYYHNDINMAMMYGEVLYYKEIMSDTHKIYKYIIKYHNATYKITKDKENIIEFYRIKNKENFKVF